MMSILITFTGKQWAEANDDVLKYTYWEKCSWTETIIEYLLYTFHIIKQRRFAKCSNSCFITFVNFKKTKHFTQKKKYSERTNSQNSIYSREGNALRVARSCLWFTLIFRFWFPFFLFFWALRNNRLTNQIVLNINDIKYFSQFKQSNQKLDPSFLAVVQP